MEDHRTKLARIAKEAKAKQEASGDVGAFDERFARAAMLGALLQEQMVGCLRALRKEGFISMMNYRDAISLSCGVKTVKLHVEASGATSREAKVSLEFNGTGNSVKKDEWSASGDNRDEDLEARAKRCGEEMMVYLCDQMAV